MDFDGLCDVFGTLSAETVARKVEGRQRPVILDAISKSDNACQQTRLEPPPEQRH